MAEKINVVGYDTAYDLEKIKDSVVKIGEKYYMRHDDSRIVWINNEEGKKRAYTITSPKIVLDPIKGSYILKSMAIYTEDGVWLDKTSKDIVLIEGKYYRKGYCITIDNKTYLKSDPRLASCPITGLNFLAETGVTLSEDYYGPRYIVSPKANITKLEDGRLIRTDQLYKYFDGVTGKILLTHSRDPIIRNGSMNNVLVDFQDKTNPQEDRLVFLPCLTKYITFQDPLHPTREFYFTKFNFFEGDGNTYYLHKSLVSYFTEAKEKYIVPRRMTKLEAIRKKHIDTFSDMDETENTTKVFRHVPKPYAGKQQLFTPNSYGNIVKSKSFSKTGGIEFSFGVEFETSNGLIPNDILDRLGLLAVGDRSVGAGEYVTSPMQGNAGIEVLEEFCKLGLTPHTLVDDRCGLHVHVGSIHNKADKPESYQAPSFNKHFLLNSIKLGALIEGELYSCLPPNRTPTLYHCHSIKRWHDITADNFDVYLGAYIFGQKEWWLKPTDQCPTQLFNFADYKLNGTDRNHTRQLGVWAEGRYKWLNLIHAYTKSAHKTIEFRIFSATTTFEKTYAALLTSLAFTYVVDNNTEIIKPGVTLSQVFATAYKGYPKLVTFLNDFYGARKEKFKREHIYVDNKGKKLDLSFLK